MSHDFKAVLDKLVKIQQLSVEDTLTAIRALEIAIKAEVKCDHVWGGLSVGNAYRYFCAKCCSVKEHGDIEKELEKIV